MSLISLNIHKIHSRLFLADGFALSYQTQHDGFGFALPVHNLMSNLEAGPSRTFVNASSITGKNPYAYIYIIVRHNSSDQWRNLHRPCDRGVNKTQGPCRQD